MKKDYWNILNDLQAPPGEQAVAVALQRADDFTAQRGSRYPGAVECLGSNLSALTAHLHFPAEHRVSGAATAGAHLR